jgi:uncharacterized protein (TIGR02145 family)
MRTFFKCLLLCSLILNGCSEKEESLYLELNTKALTFESEGGSQTIAVASNGEWTVSGETDWCKVSPKTGKGDLAVAVNVSENKSSDERKTTLLFKCGTETAKVELVQSDGAYVIINGVKWATCNVGAPHTFVQSPTDYGEYYQWNKGTTNFLLYDDYYNSGYFNSTTWRPANDPSPSGYRVPTLEEIESLVNTTYVTNEWTTRNGINGRQFTDRTTGKSIFLPAAGYRYDHDGVLYGDGGYGRYWSSTQYDYISGNAYSLYFYSGYARWGDWYYGSNGFSVRPVAD